jgi:hypothetical protein
VSVRSRGTERSDAATGAVKGTRGVRILSVRRRRGGELDREGAGHGHAARMGVPAHGAYAARGLGSWKLDGPHAVLARKEEAEALREALSPGAWRRHHGIVAALTAIDWRSRTMRHLGGNAACQQFAGEVACEGMRRHLTEAWMEHLCAGVAEISPVGSVRGADAGGSGDRTP